MIKLSNLNIKNLKLIILILLLQLLLLTFSITFIGNKVYATPSNFTQEIYPITECNDGIDNDGDGGIDFATDPQCTSWTDPSEFPDPIPPISFPEEPEEPEEPDNGVIPIFNIPISDEVEEALTPVNDILTEFLWSPIGKALGVDERIIKRESTSYTSVTLVLLSLSYVAIIGGVAYLYVKSRKPIKVNP